MKRRSFLLGSGALVIIGQVAGWARAADKATLPYAAASVAPVVCFGMYRLNPAYEGPLFQVARDSDGEVMTVGQVHYPDIDLWGPDMERLAAFAADTKIYLAKIYRQDTTGGTIAPLAQKPVVTPFGYFSRHIPGLCFENAIISNGKEDPDQSLLLSGLSLNSRSHSAFMGVEMSHQGRDLPLMELASPSGYKVGFGHRSDSASNGLALLSGAGADITTFATQAYPDLAPRVLGYVAGPDHTTQYCGDAPPYRDKALTADTYSRGVIGNCSQGFVNDDGQVHHGGMIFSGYCLYDKDLGDADRQAVQAALNACQGGHPTAGGVVMFDGDSITDGAYAAYFESYPKLAAQLLSQPSRVYNVALSGGNLTTQSHWYDLHVKPGHDAKAPFNILCLSIGTNDIGDAAGPKRTADDIWSDLQAYCARAASDGFTLILSTIRARDQFLKNPDQEATRRELNDRIRKQGAGTLKAATIIDYDQVPALGDPNGRGFVDGTHETDYGRRIEAPLWAKAINEVVASR